MELRFQKHQSSGNASTALMNLLCYEISGKVVTRFHVKKQWHWETVNAVLMELLQRKFMELQGIELLVDGSYHCIERECGFSIYMKVKPFQAPIDHWTVWHFWMDKEKGPIVEFISDGVMGL